jgi:hypothetical protein
VRFVGPAGMKISWYAPRADGRPGFSSQYLEAPARYNFLQASVYRLKLTDVPNRPGLELYPTLEVVPAKAKTCSFLAHSAVPVSFTDADFDQVAAGNYVVKVIYLPDPQFQDLAATGIDELVSSQLEPGVDPIAEAQRRGSILLVVRLGNIDLEAPNTPAMDAPNPFCPPPQHPPAGHPMPPGMGQGAGPMVPYTTVSRPSMMGLPGMLPPPGMMPPAPWHAARRDAPDGDAAGRDDAGRPHGRRTPGGGAGRASGQHPAETGASRPADDTGRAGGEGFHDGVRAAGAVQGAVGPAPHGGGAGRPAHDVDLGEQQVVLLSFRRGP